MATSQISKVIDYLRRTALVGGEADLTDGQLLECFVRHRDEAAAAALVRRHGPMVWGVCRRVLHSHHDAEDAFQATFLVLLRRAASITSRELVANWLYGVAHQTALKARATAAKRMGREKPMSEMPESAAGAAPDLWSDLQPLLDQELSRLPDKYRLAIVLCDLEGKSRKEAAHQLKVPEGTLSSRLTTARTMLATRLARHGLTVSGVAVAAVLTQNVASAALPASVLSVTIKAVTLVAAGNTAAAGLISAEVAALTDGVVKSMLLTKLKSVTTLIVMLSMLTLTSVMVLAWTFSAEKPATRAEEQAALAQDEGDPSKKFTNSIGMKFVWIPPGTFMMGGPQDERERLANVPQHKVTLTKGFFMGVYAVTQEQWKEVMGNNPSRFKGEKNLPVETISWDDCQEFVKKLREKDKKAYRLPTEAEWEYCCRAGTKTPFHFGETISTDQSNYHGDYTYGDGKKGIFRKKTMPVGSFPANAWGLYDMHGNVFSWCQDWYGPYPEKDVVDPLGSKETRFAGELRVVRGGSWSAPPCPAACRGGDGPTERRPGIFGLRVCFCLDSAEKQANVEKQAAPAQPKDPPKDSVVAQDKKKTDSEPSGALLSKNEALTDKDEKDADPEFKNSPRKVYKIKLTEGKTYQIDLKSQDFDAVLRLEDSAGKEIAFNDDFEPTSSDSRIVQTIGNTGEYKIIATCLDGKTGKFKLTVVETKAGAAGQGPAASVFMAGKAIELTLKDGKASYTGELTKDDTAATFGYFKLFSIKLEAGKTYRIDDRAAGANPNFDPLLFLEDAQGKELARDDDSGGGLNARIVYKAPSTGVYRIIATTTNTNQTGKFTIEVMPGTAEDEKLVRMRERIADYSKSPAAEQQKIVADATKHFQGKGAGLAAADAQMAMQLGGSLEQGDPEVAKSTYKSLAKAFSVASNPQIAIVAKHFEGSLKQLEMIGKEMLIVGKTVDGKDFDLKNFQGKVVLVDFWATWCGPCIGEMPNIERAYDKYHGKGFEVIGVALDRSDADITKFTEARKMKWTSINVDGSKALADRYGVTSIPFPVLVDQAGNVVSTRARGPELDMLLERLLGDKSK